MSPTPVRACGTSRATATCSLVKMQLSKSRRQSKETGWRLPGTRHVNTSRTSRILIRLVPMPRLPRHQRMPCPPPAQPVARVWSRERPDAERTPEVSSGGVLSIRVAAEPGNRIVDDYPYVGTFARSARNSLAQSALIPKGKSLRGMMSSRLQMSSSTNSTRL